MSVIFTNQRCCMKKLVYFSFLFFLPTHSALYAAQQPQEKILVIGKDVTEEACFFELYCRDSRLILDKNKVLAYVKDPKNDINAIIPGFFGYEEELKNKDSFLRDCLWAQADTFRLPCLQRACMHNDKEIIHALLQRKNVDVNERNRHGITALGYACTNSTADIVQLLLQHGANVNAENDCGSTILEEACRHGKYDAIKILLACNDIDVNKGRVETPLFFAARINLDILNMLLDSEKVKLDATNDQKQSWFYVAWVYNCLTQGATALNLFFSWDQSKRELFLHNQLCMLSGMHSLPHGEHDVREFILFCFNNGAHLNRNCQTGGTPFHQASEIYHLLKRYLHKNNPELVVKKIVYRAFKKIYSERGLI